MDQPVLDNPNDSDTHNNAGTKVATEQGAIAQLKEKKPRRAINRPQEGGFKELPVRFVQDVMNFINGPTKFN